MKKMLSVLIIILALLVSNLGVSAASKSNELSSASALKIALSANQHYWNTMNGHIPSKKTPVCKVKPFHYKGKEYRYFCNELGTKKKLTSYLNEVFTLNAINKGIKKYSFIEHKGKLAQPNADGGSLLDWKKSKLKLVYSKKDVRQYEFSVPSANKGQYQKKKVTYVKVNNKWLINAIDAVK